MGIIGTETNNRCMALDERYKQIKENVWKWEKAGNCFSVKRYRSMSTAMKVRYIHDQLRSIAFPHIVPVMPEDGESPLTFIQPWLEGAKAVNFKKRADRTDSLAALQALHATKKELDWHVSPYLHIHPLVAKWEDRIERFHDIRGACESFIEKGLVDDILLYAIEAMSIIRKSYIGTKDPTLLHGDVVHHNILRDPSGMIRFIDFDLACSGPAGTEVALWIHRVLPQIGYDIEFLFDEQPSLKELDQDLLPLLLYPNELLREWLHLFTLPAESRTRQANRLVPFTQNALSHWPKLWYDVERINV
ncbi:phosphotransferase [Sporosarcina sp. 179-K 3D1 HS]|uniref:phosphotransferase n=1 Tax=Sporosarcina sp. 179-K 3D1 HS TaxID=3232169 RepID=UPI0039A0279E